MRHLRIFVILSVALSLVACQDPAPILESMRTALPSAVDSVSLENSETAVTTAATATAQSYAPADEQAPSGRRDDDGPHVLSVQSPLYQQIAPTYAERKLPEGFFYAEELIPEVLLEPRYAGEDNFMAQVLPGYAAPRVVVSQELGQALAKAQEALRQMGLGLKIYDAYRPLRAEEAMRIWALADDRQGNREYYPRLEKQQILQYGYVAVGTGHTRGASVDLTLIDLECGCELDMGGSFDLFDTQSHTMSEQVSELAQENRLLLKTVLETYGFRNFAEEWWHYTLIDEPYPEQNFDFIIE